MKRIFVLTFVATAFCVSAAAQQAMPSMMISDDPVALAHAGGSIALNPNAFALENNSAAMSFYEGTVDTGISYGLWQPSTQKSSMVGVGAFGKIGKKWAIGLDMKFSLLPSYDIYDSDGRTPQLDGSFSPSESNFALGASYMIAPWVSVGLNAKLVTSKLASEAKATCFAADIYAAFKSQFGLTGGLGVCNLGTKANYGGETSYALPSYLRAGVAYSIVGVSADLELDYVFSGAFMSAVSVGYWYKEYVGFNIGYHYGSDKANTSDGSVNTAGSVNTSDGSVNTAGSAMSVNPLCVPSYLSLGLGGQFKGIHLDFAYLLGTSAVKNSLCLSLGYRF